MTLLGRLRSEHPGSGGDRKGTAGSRLGVGRLRYAKRESDPGDLTRGNRPIGAIIAGAQERRSAGAQERRSAGAQERPTCVLGVGSW